MFGIVGRNVLHSSLILFKYQFGGLQLSVQLVSNREGAPALANVRPVLEQYLTTFDESIKMSKLCLHVCRVAQDIQVVLEDEV
jgi:hypothetical protein